MKTRMCIVAAALGILALRLFLLCHRYFDVDEMEHLHAVWCMAQGQALYKDFFEHHGALWYLLILPIPHFFSDPIHALWAGRALMTGFWLGIFGLQWKLGGLRAGRFERVLALALLASFTSYALKSLEIRPDVPGAFLATAIAWAGVSLRSRRSAPVLGFALGVSLFVSTKVLYPALGVVIGILWRQRRNPQWSLRKSLNYWGSAGLCALIGPAISVLYLAAQGSLPDFWRWYVVFNLTLKSLFSIWPLFWKSAAQNPVLWGLGILGLAAGLKEAGIGQAGRRQEEGADTDLPAWLGLAAGLIGIAFLGPSPFEQYFLLFSPLLALAAARGFMAIAPRTPGGGLRPIFPRLLGLSLLPSIFLQAQTGIRRPNTWDIERIQCVMTHTAPEDKILGFWSGEAFYRPHAYFFAWLWRDIVHSLGETDVLNDLVGVLRDPATKGVLWDPLFFRRHPGLGQFVKDHYEYSGCGLLYIRKGNVESQG